VIGFSETERAQINTRRGCYLYSQKDTLETAVNFDKETSTLKGLAAEAASSVLYEEGGSKPFLHNGDTANQLQSSRSWLLAGLGYFSFRDGPRCEDSTWILYF
jgi:hypothetical protein